MDSVNAEMDIYKRSGLSPMIVMFRFYGFYFGDIKANSKIKIKRKNMVVITMQMIALFFMAIMYFKFLYACYYVPGPKLITLNSPYGISISFKYIGLLTIYFDIYFKVDDWHQLLHKLATNINSIKSEAVRLKVVKRIKTYMFWGIVTFIAAILFRIVPIITFDFQFFFTPNLNYGAIDTMLLKTHMISIARFLFTITISSILAWLTVTFLIISELLHVTTENDLRKRCASSRLRSNQIRKLLKNHQISHQEFNELVKEVENVASRFLLVSLIIELMLATANTNRIRTCTILPDLFIVLIELVEITFTFVIKAVAFSRINDKFDAGDCMVNMDSKTLFNKTGLSVFIKVYKIFGFYFDIDSDLRANIVSNKSATKSKNKLTAACYYGMFALAILNQLYTIWKFYSLPGPKTVLHSQSMMADFVKRISLFVMYHLMYTKSDKWANFFHRLATNIDQIQPENKRLKTVKTIKRYIKWGIVGYLALLMNSLCMMAIWFSPMLLYFEYQIKTLYTVIYWLLSWSTADSFWIWMSISAIIISELLIISIDSNFQNCNKICQLRNSRHERYRLYIKSHQITHKRMSKLVFEAEELISTFLLITLLLEVLYFISCSIIFQSDELTTTIIAVTVQVCSFSLTFLLKVIAFSNVNDKVKFASKFIDNSK
ncbi:hypothetical protein CHUAL_003562 [Chamberlinius hualienensis]